MYGELSPVGGGDPIPLLKKSLLVGRRESCDIVLRFPNVSTHHCQLTLSAGYWYVRDMQSRNGTKVNGKRVTDCVITPGDILSIAKHKYEVQYSPFDLGALGPPPVNAVETDIFSKSLLQRAGLESRQFSHTETPPAGPEDVPRYDITNDEPGQLRIRPNRR
jgi:pSer/pThr/pTyr-binding forkhead associated (FHA) protein